MNNQTHSAIIFTVILTTLLPWTITYASEEASTSVVYEKLPVKEVTIFKDGYAFVLHEGTVQTNEIGDVVLNELPEPIMGTFWAYSAVPENKLQCVISSRDSIEKKADAADLTELLKANPGKQVLIKEHSGQIYQAGIIKLLNNMVLLKLHEGTKAIPVEQIQNITFLEDLNDSVIRKTTQETLTFKLEHESEQSNVPAEVGMAYVQKGIRWIPSYRVEIDGQGNAVIKLKGTIINELADLDDVSAHLVVGVPRFAFKDTPDPISFQETIAQLSQHFNPTSRTAYAYSNAIRTQARFSEMQRADLGPAEDDLGPELTGMKANEDLFVFHLEHITLKKGQRMVLGIAEYTLAYEDIYTVDLNFAPPLEMRRNFNSNQHLELAKLFYGPKATHKIRLMNESAYPLTTAPAMILKDGRILAQGMMKYTSIGGKGDLEITTAVDIKVKNSDVQEKMTPNAVNWNESSYTKIDMAGTIELTNYSDKKVTVHVKRSVLGNMDEATQNGIVKQLGHGYDGFTFQDGMPFWWNWCSWPWWWYHFNSIGQTNWEIELESKEDIKLNYNWHYYWR